MILDLLFVLLVAAIASALGLRMLGCDTPRPAFATDNLALALPLGLGTIALAVLGLAQLGYLTRPALAALLVAAAACGSWSRLRSSWPRHSGPPESPPSRSDLAVRLAIAIGLAGTLLTALAPVTDGDALCYHLQVPKRFLETASAFYDADLHETVYPLLTEMLYALALAFRGPVACRLIQWLLGVALALGATALARPALGARASWAGAVALLVPAVSNGMSAPLNDVALAAFCTAALLAWLRWRECPSLAAAIRAGGLAGLALGVKFPALVWVGLIGLSHLALVLSRSGPRVACPRFRTALGMLLAFAFVAFLVGGPWYLRATLATGNPVHPFFRSTFGGAGLDEVLDPIKRPLAVTPWNLALALVPMTLQPDRFDSFSHQFGPAFLLFLPGLLLLRPPRSVVSLAGFAMLFLTICLTQRQSMRFVLAAVGPLAVGVAWVASRSSLRPALAARAVLLAFLAVLGFESALALARARHGLPVVLGLENTSHFLARREPTFVVGRWMSANLPPGARVIGQDHRGFYLPRPYTMELAHRRRTGLGQGGQSPEAIVATLRERGFTHLLLCPPVPGDAVEFDPQLGRLLEPWLETHPPLYRQDLADADGVTRRYSIHRLGPETATETLARLGPPLGRSPAR